MALSTFFNPLAGLNLHSVPTFDLSAAVKEYTARGLGKSLFTRDIVTADKTKPAFGGMSAKGSAGGKKTPAWIPAFLVMVGLPADAVGPNYDPEHTPPNSTNTRNDLNKGGCPPAVLLFARGTVEPGNMGSIIGPPLEAEIKKRGLDKQIAIQGINYATTKLQGGFMTGVQQMASLAEKTAQRCPKTKIMLGGYSQGGWLTHIAIGKMNAQTQHHIAAVLIWGNPEFFMSGHPAFLKARGKTFCRKQDIVCFGLGTTPGTHVSYSGYHGAKDDTPTAVDFMVKQLKAPFPVQ